MDSATEATDLRGVPIVGVYKLVSSGRDSYIICSSSGDSNFIV